MYGHAFPTTSMQQQGQAGQAPTGAASAGLSANGNINFANMMGMNGLMGPGANGMPMTGLEGQFQSGDAGGAPNGINPTLMFNPQLQALLQQQMAQQTAQPGMQQQPPSQQQMRRGLTGNAAIAGQGPGTNFMQMSTAGPIQGLAQPQQSQPSGQFGQPFNPFVQQQQQPQQQQQQQSQQHQQTSQVQPNYAMQMAGMSSLNNYATYLAQAQQQQQRPSGQANVGFNPAAFMNLSQDGAAQGLGATGMIDPNALMQQAASYGITQSGGPGSIPMHMQANPSAPPAQASPKPSSNGIATPEPKAKGRPKGSTKKKKEEEEARRRQQLQQQQSFQQQQQMQGTPYAHSSMPSPAPSFQQTPTQSNSSIPMHASPSISQTLSQQQERARSHTRSPNMNNPLPRPGTSGSLPASMAFAGGKAAQRNIPPGWMPSLSAEQQQQLLGQALSFSKAQSGRTANGQQAPSPAHILMQLGYVYVKATVLPNNGQGAGIPGNGTSGAGAVLSIDEARMIGILPQPGQSQPTQTAQQGIAVGLHPSLQTPQAPPASSGTQMQTPQQAHPMAPPHVQEASANLAYRASPSGFPPMVPSMHPSSPSAANVASPARKSVSNRVRQASVASRPSSSQGRQVPEGGAQQSPFPAFKQAPPAQSQQMSSASGARSGVNPLMASAAVSTSHAQAGPPLPPVHGGPLPKQTKEGLDVAEYNTRITPLPPSHILTADASKSAIEELWKPLNLSEEAELLTIMSKDKEYTKLMSAQAQQHNVILLKRLQDMRPIGACLHWWERGVDEDQSLLGKDGPYESFKVLLPADKRNLRASQGIRSALFPTASIKQVTLERQTASKFDEDLVPVRLEIEHEGWVLRDTFTWPAPESYKGEMIDRFAMTLCEDFGIPTAQFVPAIRESILSQVSEHTAAEAIRPLQSKRHREQVMGRGRLNEAALRWWKCWRRKVEADKERVDLESESRITALDSEDEEVEKGNTEAEMRIQIKLDITVGAMNLVDQFEWDVSDEGSGAEAFAAIFAADLGLSGEFRTAIAHSIREQVDVYMRSLALVGYTFDGKEVLDDELREPLLSTVGGVARSQTDVELHTPRLMQLSELEILQSEREREKESRRKRRQTRGRRGVNLPDREPLKTTRTPAVFGLQQSINHQSMDSAAVNAEFFGLPLSSTRSAAISGLTSAGTRGGAGISTRRAAAAAANATIAPNSSMHDDGTPTPAPEGSTPVRNGRRLSTKRRRLESQSVYFDFPGGLGRPDEEENGGPRFAPSFGHNRREEERSAAELGSAPSKKALHGLFAQQQQHHSIHQQQQHQQQQAPAASVLSLGTTSSAAPVAWNMSKPEEAANQHPNWHDGQWYCSNCGVPGVLDHTRRKGPLGDKTLCGICGKFFHRHRKARPAEYTRDFAHHRRELAARGIRVEALQIDEHTNSNSHSTTDSPTPAAHKESLTSGGIGSLPVPLPSGNPAAIAATVEGMTAIESPARVLPLPEEQQQTPVKVEKDAWPNHTRGNSPDLPFEQVGSPDDSDSSESSHHVLVEKRTESEASAGRSLSPAKLLPAVPLSTAPPPQGSPAAGVASPLPAAAMTASTTASAGTSPRLNIPEWLGQACHALRLRFPLDRFEVLVRPRAAGVPPPAIPEWRIRCQDCPGKLYTPGPGESLTNFEIHLKNRAHRAAVQKAVQTEGRRPYSAP